MKKQVLNFVRWSAMILLVAIGLTHIDAGAKVEAANLHQEGPTYIVQSGDTLNSIALRFGVSPDELQSVNGIADPNALNIGQSLIIPGLEGITGVLTSTVLGFGTSINDLTRQYGLDPEDLVLLNRLTSPTETIAGATFIIPMSENQDIDRSIVTIESGQTLLETAIRKGESPWMLVENNQLKAAWDILPGDRLYGKSSEENAAADASLITNISITPLPLVQGETVQIAVQSSAPVELSGSFGEEDLHFFSENEGVYYSFLGVHALADPGPYYLEINATQEGGSQHSFGQLVLLEEGGYSNEWVFVPEEYLDETVIAEEDAYLKPVLTRNSPTKHWQGKFQYPIDEPCINSFFGQRRDYNEGALFFYHTGLDFAVCAQNKNIYAPADGEVILAEELTIKGKAILIDHGWGVISGYWHLAEFNAAVGDFVQTGDIIGQIGNTGRSAGPHLHFEIDIYGIPVNPETWLEQEFPQSVASTDGLD